MQIDKAGYRLIVLELIYSGLEACMSFDGSHAGVIISLIFVDRLRLYFELVLSYLGLFLLHVLNNIIRLTSYFYVRQSYILPSISLIIVRGESQTGVFFQLDQDINKS